MRYVKILAVTVFSVSILLVVIFIIIRNFTPKKGGIFVDSSPEANVFINDEYVGKTPFKKTYEKGTVKVKIETNQENDNSYLVEVNIVPGIESIVKYDFKNTKEESSGFSLSLDKDNEKSTSAVIITDPDNSQIFIDDSLKGFSPTKSNVGFGKHKITIKKIDYVDKIVTVNVLQGYKLTLYVKLAKAPQESPSPIPTPSIKTYIQILDTPTGFLRVRTEAGSNGEEIAEVKPGTKYLFLAEDAETGWYKIQYSEPKAGLPDGIQGWVSNQYSKKVEE